MISNHISGYAVECDICGQETFYQVLDFSTLLDEMKRDGWKSEKIADEWENYCRACANKKEN